MIPCSCRNHIYCWELTLEELKDTDQMTFIKNQFFLANIGIIAFIQGFYLYLEEDASIRIFCNEIHSMIVYF